MNRSSCLLRALVCGLLLLGAVPSLHAAAADSAAGSIGDARVSAQSSLRRAFHLPAGPKRLSFNATLQDSVNSLPHRDNFSYKITDSAGSLLLTVLFKPTSQSVNPDEEDATWEVFFAIGSDPPVSTNTTVPEGQLMTYSIILTTKGITFRFGPVGESFIFSTKPRIPTAKSSLAAGDSNSGPGNSQSGLAYSNPRVAGPHGYDLSDRTLSIDFEWQTPDGNQPGANEFQFRGFSVLPSFVGGIRSPNEPDVRIPRKPVVSPS